MFATKDASAGTCSCSKFGTPPDQKKGKSSSSLYGIGDQVESFSAVCNVQLLPFSKDKDASSVTSGRLLAVLDKMWYEKHVCDSSSAASMYILVQQRIDFISKEKEKKPK